MNVDTFSFNLNSPTVHADMVGQAVIQLENLLEKTRNRQELEWEIRVYRWILAQENPEETAKAWFAARGEHGHDKRKRVKALGWSIP